MGYGYPALPDDPQRVWEEEQKKREREMMEALRNIEKQSLPSNPGSIDSPMPEDEYLEEYAGHVRDMPRVEEHQPSTLRKVLATIAGTLTGSPDLARTISWNKYDTAMGEWNRRKDALKDVADVGQRYRATDVAELGQRRTMEEGRRRREFEGAESEQDRQSRAGEADTQRRWASEEAGTERTFREGESRKERDFTSGEADERREFEREEGKLDRASREKLYGVGKLSATQQGHLESLAIQRVLDVNPDWERFFEKDDDGNIVGVVPDINKPVPLWFDSRQERSNDPEWNAFVAALEQARQEIAKTAGVAGGIPPLGLELGDVPPPGAR